MVRQYSAGGCVYRLNSDDLIEWLIVKPTGKNRWQLPKGWIDSGETSQNAALREVREEGGVEGELVGKVDTITIFFAEKGERIVKKINFYLIKYLKEAKEGHDWETEEVIWLPYEQAFEKLTFKSEKEVLKKANEILSGGVG
ncbi:MAG: NUDIX domain-containing protein [Candidatus Blackburnbacteria bacterium]|nr:NUDIX domain-containing protein [Candidatus Blackburnbacteria bacterium]